MCDFLSFVVTIEKNPRILCASLLHHEKTIEYLALKLETYREAEWTEDDDGRSLTVRAAPGENANVLKSAVLAAYPTRVKCLQECLRQFKESTGRLDCSNCESLTSVEAPKATRLDCSNCESLTSVEAPKATKLYCYNCESLTSVEAPKATELYCSNCPKLKQ